ncbi:hypothetical protein GGI23_007889, partial [Coemansia sp. RSA 2559]
MDSDEESLEDLFDSSPKPSTAVADTSLVSIHNDGSVEKVPEEPKALMEDKAGKLSIPSQAAPQQESKEDIDAAQIHHPIAPRVPKKIPPGIVKFTDFFGCQVVRHTRKPRRNWPSKREEEDDEDQQQGSQQRLLLAQPALDTRKLLSGTQQVPKNER